MHPRKQGLILLSVGLVIISVAFGWRIYQRTTLSFKGDLPKYSEVKQGSPPKRLEVASIRVNLSVEPGSITDGVWSVSEKGATYLLGSGYPGEKENIVIYGHNKNSILGPIRWLNKGDEIKIQNEEGKYYIYKVEETKEVEASDIKYVSPTGQEMLTIYTCTGFLDSKRFMVIAKPK